MGENPALVFGRVRGAEFEGRTCIERGEETIQGQSEGVPFLLLFANNPTTPPPHPHPLSPTPPPHLEGDKPLLLIIDLICFGLVLILYGF